MPDLAGGVLPPASKGTDGVSSVVTTSCQMLLQADDPEVTWAIRAAMLQKLRRHLISLRTPSNLSGLHMPPKRANHSEGVERAAAREQAGTQRRRDSVMEHVVIEEARNLVPRLYEWQPRLVQLQVQLNQLFEVRDRFEKGEPVSLRQLSDDVQMLCQRTMEEHQQLRSQLGCPPLVI